MTQAPLGEKPEEPTPEDFGFTVDRVTWLENPGFDEPPPRLAVGPSWPFVSDLCGRSAPLAAVAELGR
jgi:hypothetical protein